MRTSNTVNSYHTLKNSPHFNKILNIHFSMIEGFYWMMMGTINGYMIILLQDRGFTLYSIGIIMSCKTFISLYSQFLLSYIGDRFSNIPIKYLIGICLVLCFFANFILWLYSFGFLITLLLFFVMGATENSIVSLIDSLSMQYLNCGFAIRYSSCRAVGSFCYAFFCLLLGKIMRCFPSDIVLMFHGVTMLFLFIIVITFPRFYSKWKEFYAIDTNNPISKKLPIKKPSVKNMFHSFPIYIPFLLSTCFASAAFSSNSNYLSSIILSAGGDSGDVGIGIFLHAISEVPVMLFLFPLLLKKHPLQRLISFSLLAMLIRWSLTALIDNIYLLVIVQSLQSLGYGLYLPSCIHFINRAIPAPNQIKAQTFFMIFTNLGTTVGNYIAGISLSTFGAKGMLIINDVFLIVSIAIMYFVNHSRSMRAFDTR